MIGQPDEENQSKPPDPDQHNGQDEVERILIEAGRIVLDKLNKSDLKDLVQIALVAATVGLVIIGIFQAIGAEKSAEQAKISADTAKLALESENRPWIGMEGPIRVDFRVDPAPPIPNWVPQADAQLVGDLRNFGAYPATKVHTSATLVFSASEGLPPSDPVSSVLIKSQCAIANPTVNEPNIFIFPTLSHPLDMHIVGSFRTVKPEEVRQIWIPLCITYTGVRGDTHSTTFLFASSPINGISQPIAKWFLWSENAQER